MSINIIRAWKDEEYRKRLTDAERATLPEKPARMIELTDADLNAVIGGADTTPQLECTGALGCCSSGIHNCGLSSLIATYGCCPDN